MRRKNESKLDTPHIKDQVVKRLLTGESQGSIAKDIGVDQSLISRWKNRDDIKKFIEEESLRLLESVPDAVDNMKTLVALMKNLPMDDHKNRELSFKATKKILESSGLLPTVKTSTHYQTIINSENITLSPLVLSLVQDHLNKIDDQDDAIEVDYSEL